MRLDELTTGLPGGGRAQTGAGLGALEVRGLAYDSRSVRPGDLFFCVGGLRSDGHEFAGQALARGAAALVVERPLGLGAPEIVVPSPRAAMAELAARFYGDPSAELAVVGVTGTNGKTTTAYLVRALLEASGRRCGLLGTVKSVVGGEERPVERTTPEAIDLQADFRAMLDGGDRACAMEVSSHALELDRAAAIHFAAAIFTNISRDHLDFHGTMEDYFQAKRRLFLPASPGSPESVSPDARGREPGRPRTEAPALSVVNVGDPHGQRLAAEIDGVRTFAVEAPADYRASALRCDFEGCRFTLQTPVGEREVALPMPGRFNVANAIAAIATVHALGAGELDVLVAATEGGVRVPGRFEPVDEGQDFAVLVDYAHTPDSLENVLRSARELTAPERDQGRVLCVFGAGGDRDRGKRPLMGEVATRLADVVIVTSDNPRSEDPERIIAEIIAGMQPPAGGRPHTSGEPPSGPRAAPVSAIEDRASAIAQAIAWGRPGDVLVIAGKGHEQGQELAGARKIPFDDVSVAREALRARASRSIDQRPTGARA
jgi:UDP-N-acetylmuramoyl-L-alanyl-D-glutamate--2,6-diaminopimelate ligase